MLRRKSPKRKHRKRKSTSARKRLTTRKTQLGVSNHLAAEAAEAAVTIATGRSSSLKKMAIPSPKAS